MELSEFWRQHPSAAVAFSGGVDSAFLLLSAVQAGAKVTAYYVKTEFQPQFELEDARALSQQLGVPLTVLELSALAVPRVAENPQNRCYYCKQSIFRAIFLQARQDGYTVVLDGTNASDEAGDRPGMQALAELQVLSPLRLCGLSKQEIRRRSREAGLFTWNKPAYACLATRIPTGRIITAADLSAVEQAEACLRGLGFSDFRVRLTPDGAKLQVPEEQLSSVLQHRTQILHRLSQFFGTVTLDLQARGSLPAEDGCCTDQVAELRCNLDDMTGEEIAFCMERLLEEGALDVWTTPITMKKSRPAVLLSCLCKPAETGVFQQLLFRYTSTLGIRTTYCDRVCLQRSFTERGGIRIKESHGFGVSKQKPEFEDLAALARQLGCSLSEARSIMDGQEPRR